MRLPLSAFLLLAALSAPLPAFAQATVPAPAPAGSVPSPHIFGTLRGTEIGPVGRWEIEASSQTMASPTRRMVSPFRSTSAFDRDRTSIALSAANTVLPHLRVGLGGSAAYDHYSLRFCSFRGDCVDSQTSRFSLESVAAEIEWRFLPRTGTGLAASLSIAPEYTYIDRYALGVEQSAGVAVSLRADMSLVPGILHAAVNVGYVVGWQRADWSESRPWIDQSTFVLAGALTWQATEQLFLGAQVSHQRLAEGAFLNWRLGEATFAGPTFAFRVLPNATLSAAWRTQVSGSAPGLTEKLNLFQFPRHMFNTRLAVTF